MNSLKQARIFSRIRVLYADASALSIRFSLALLVTACVLPGSLMSAYLIFDGYQTQRSLLIRDTIATARAMASTLDRDLASVESGLHVLATTPWLASDDFAGFYRRAREVLPSQAANNYVVIDSSGRQILNTLVPYGEPLPERGGPPQLKEIFERDTTVVTDIFIGPVTGKPIVAMGVPVHRDGKIIYSLNVGIFPERVGALLQRQRLPQGWIGVVFDRAGVVIARTHAMDRFVGKSALPALVKAARNAVEGTVDTVMLDGVPVNVAFSRSELSQWTVAVNIPASVLTEGLKTSLWLLVAMTAALLAGGLWLAWNLGDRIARAIQGLTAPALALGSGKAIIVPPLHLKEADEVGHALIAASNLLLQAQHDAHYDVLTGLANRALFHEILNHQLAICVRDGTELSLLYIDLDGFKPINDLHGHAIGDALLQGVAARIKAGIRNSDVAARIGGDEFVVFLVESGIELAKTIAEKLVASLSQSYTLHPLHRLDIRVTASIGIATFPGSARSSAVLLQRADAAMYAAKKSGKNTYAVAAPVERE